MEHIKSKQKWKHECPAVVIYPKLGAEKTVCARMRRHSAQSWGEETLWLVPSLAALWVLGRWNVRQPAAPAVDAGGSRLGVQVGVLVDMGVVRSMAGSLLWQRRDPDTTADVATAGLCVKNSAGTVHTDKASPHYGHACVSRGGSAE